MIVPLIPKGEYNRDGEYAVPEGFASAVYDADLSGGVVRPRPGFALRWTPPGYDGTEYCKGYCPARYTANTLYRLTATVKSGACQISDGSSAATVAGDASSADVQQKLDSLSSIFTGDVHCYGGPLDQGPVYIEFVGRFSGISAGVPPLQLTGTNTANATLVKLVDGGYYEKHVIAIAKGPNAKLYAVDGLTWSHELLAQDLPLDDYGMVQYGDSVWITSRSTGLTRYRIGGSYAGGGNPSDSPPPPPSGSVSATGAGVPDLPSRTLTPTGTGWDTGWVVHQASMSAATIEHRITKSNTFFATLDSQSQRTVTVTFNSAMDLRERRWWFVEIAGGSPISGRDNFHVDKLEAKSGSNWIQATATAVTHPGGNDRRTWLLARLPEGVSACDGLRVTLRVWGVRVNSANPVAIRMRSVAAIVPVEASRANVQAYADSLGAASSSMEAVQYAAAYQSPGGVYGPIGGETFSMIARHGADALLTVKPWTPAPGAGWKAVPLRREGGAWRVLPNPDGSEGLDVSSGPATVRDTRSKNEAAALRVYRPTTIEAQTPFLYNTAGVAGVWKGCLVIGSGAKVFVSAVGDPARFAPDPDDKAAASMIDPYDDSQGVSFYASANRSERVLDVIGMDNLYVCTTDGVYVCAGDLPVDMTPPRKLPASQTPIGRGCGYDGGVLVPTRRGLMWHVAARGYDGVDQQAQASVDATQDVPLAWAWMLDQPGDYPVWVEAVGKEVFVTKGWRGLWRDKDGRWVRLRFQDGIHRMASLGTRVVCATQNGRIGEWSEDSRGQDFGGSVRWQIEYGKIVAFRLALEEAVCLCDKPVSLAAVADGRTYSTETVPGVLHADDTFAPVCTELALSARSSGVMTFGSWRLQGGYGGKKD